MIDPEVLPASQPPQLKLVQGGRYWALHRKLRNFVNSQNIRVEGAENIQQIAVRGSRSRGVLLAPAVTGVMDYAALSLLEIPKPLRFLSSDFVRRVPYLGKLASEYKLGFINPDEDRCDASMETTIDLLNKGEWVPVNPLEKSTRTVDGEHYHRVKVWIARAALLADGETPVVPIGMSHRNSFPGSGMGQFDMGMVVGEPIMVGHNHGSYWDLHIELRDRIAELNQRATQLANS